MSDPIESAIVSEHSRQEAEWNEAMADDTTSPPYNKGDPRYLAWLDGFSAALKWTKKEVLGD